MRVGAVERNQPSLEHLTFAPLARTSTAYYLVVALLLAATGWGFYAFLVQLSYGLEVTGLTDGVMWGVYIVNFVFFLGIAMAGTVISAVLRLTHAGWRTPITRMAEMVTVSALAIGALMPIIDLGRPDRIVNIMLYGRFQSAILWDIIVITTYLVGSMVYLYLPLIPDFAVMRDRMKFEPSSLKSRLLTLLAVGWQNIPEQRQRLEKAMKIMAIAIVPMAAGTHTVASFIFAWMLRPGWNSTIYGIYFVVGAIFSGIATILIVMAIVRKVYHLEQYITERHFRNLSYLMLTALFLYLYLVVTEFLTLGYKMELGEKELLSLLFLGADAPFFWFFVVAAFVIPVYLLVLRKGSPIRRIITAAISVNLAMWVARLIIVIPSLQLPEMADEVLIYTPTWVEWSITLGAFAGFMLVFAILAKLVPIISLWEMADEAKESAHAGEGK